MGFQRVVGRQGPGLRATPSMGQLRKFSETSLVETIHSKVTIRNEITCLSFRKANVLLIYKRHNFLFNMFLFGTCKT